MVAVLVALQQTEHLFSLIPRLPNTDPTVVIGSSLANTRVGVK